MQLEVDSVVSDKTLVLAAGLGLGLLLMSSKAVSGPPAPPVPPPDEDVKAEVSCELG